MIVSHRELTRKRASVSPKIPWSDTREMLLPTVLQLLRHFWNAWRHCWRTHVTLPHSCVIQVFIALAGNKRGEAMQCDARPSELIRDFSRHFRPRLGSARRKHGFLYCCVKVGACFDVTVLAWRKYVTLILFSSLRPVLPSGRFSSGVPTKSYKQSSVSHSCYMLCPSHTPRLEPLIMLGKEYKLWRSSLCSFLQLPLISSLFDPNIIFNILFLNAFGLCSYLNVRDQVSHPNRTKGKMIVLYSIIFTF
jgi:hypothetical protein